MNYHYSERSFAVDLIMSAHKTDNPALIAIKAKEELDIEVSRAEVVEYLKHIKEYNERSDRVMMTNFFSDVE